MADVYHRLSMSSIVLRPLGDEPTASTALGSTVPELREAASIEVLQRKVQQQLEQVALLNQEISECSHSLKDETVFGLVWFAVISMNRTARAVMIIIKPSPKYTI